MQADEILASLEKRLISYEGWGISAMVIHSATIETCREFGISIETLQEMLNEKELKNAS